MSDPDICTEDGCERKRFVRGLCITHYQRLRRAGLIPRQWRQHRTVERFRSKVAETDGGCWLWTGSTTTDGYGQFRADGHYQYAHRFIYDLLVGPVDGLQIGHRHTTCPRTCVNPDHLCPRTDREGNPL